MSPRSTRRIPVRLLLGVSIAVALVAAGTIGGRALLDRFGQDDEIVTVDDEPTIVQASMGDLTETFVATGTLQFDEALMVSAPTSGTVLDIVDIGTIMESGDVLARIDDRAVVWLDGAVPAWRQLADGDDGVDVLQLETALTTLGFNDEGSVTVDEEFTSATASMVEAWQESLGVAETGRIELGDVVFGGERDRVASVELAVGAPVADGGAIAAIGTSARFATLEADPGEAVSLSIGDAVALELPDRSTIEGTVAGLATGGDSWTITVEFGPQVEFPRSDVTNVEMEWTHLVAGDVVTIPSAALLRLDDGSYTVEVVNEDDSTTLVPVETGVSVGTRIEIVSGLADGVSIVTI